MTRRPWTRADRALLRRLYPNTPTAKVAKRLRRSLTTTYQTAYRLGLSKSAAYLASPASGRLRRGSHPNSARHRFTKGMTPWNLGVTGYMGANRTSFRKGRKPEDASNYRPIGSTRICVDGYLERKVSDDQSLAPARRWVAVHRLVWEAASGPVPPGHAVVFKPGRKSTEAASITLDCLELVSRDELMRRNTLHRYPKELVRAIQLRGALNRQINKRAA